LNARNSITETERLQALPCLPRDEGEPVFAEPWQAQAFALAVKLSEQGHFTWKEWADALADELNAAASRGEPDDGSRYYHHWLAALERLVTTKGLADSAALLVRKEAWAEAYRRTPHGNGSLSIRASGPDPLSARFALSRLVWLNASHSITAPQPRSRVRVVPEAKAWNPLHGDAELQVRATGRGDLENRDVPLADG
jgi:nitrile hydratase accessory protein